MKCFGLALAALIMVVMTGGPVAGASAAEAAVLRRGNGSEPESLDPAKIESVQASHILNDLFEPLVTLNAADRPVPAAAARWEVSSDGLVYQFFLRPGLQWSDGSPLTAEDFVYALRRAASPATQAPSAFLLEPLKNARAIAEGRIKDLSALGVDAPSPMVLRFTLERPTSYWLTLVSHPLFSPVKRSNVEKFGETFFEPGKLVSNGPFMLQDWVPQSRLVLVKNPNYRDAANVRIDKVIFYPIDSETEEFSRYRGGDLDITYFVPSQQIELIRQNMTGELRAEPSLTVDYLGFNLTRPPFGNNPKLRQALSMAIDRQMLVDQVVKTGAPVVYSVVPPVGLIDYFNQPASWAWLPTAEKIAKAQQLYREAGYGPAHPLELELRVQSGDNARKAALAMIAMWNQTLGVKTSLLAEDFKHFVQHRHDHADMTLFWYGWTGDYPDATTFLDLFKSNSAANDFGYANPTYDRLLGEAESTTDVNRRAGLLQQAEELLISENPVIPLYNRVNPYLVKPWVKGYHVNPCGYSYDKEVTLLPHR